MKAAFVARACGSRAARPPAAPWGPEAANLWAPRPDSRDSSGSGTASPPPFHPGPGREENSNQSPLRWNPSLKSLDHTFLTLRFICSSPLVAPVPGCGLPGSRRQKLSGQVRAFGVDNTKLCWPRKLSGTITRLGSRTVPPPPPFLCQPKEPRD